MKVASLALLALACGHAPKIAPNLNQTKDGYQLADSRWVIEAQPGGGLLPATWHLEEIDPHYVQRMELKFSRVQLDGSLWIGAIPLGEADQHKTLRTLSERQLTAFRLQLGELAFGTTVPAGTVAVDGAEAQEAVYESRKPGDYAPIQRFYLASFKPLQGDYWVSLVYSSPPQQFDEGLAEVKGLVRRFHFNGVGH